MIEPRKRIAAFDFNGAAGGTFMTPGGKDFALRLWFWMSAFLSIVFIVTIPMFVGSYGDVLEQSWLSNRAVFSGQEPPDPEGMMTALGKILPGTFVWFLGLWVVVAAGEAAFYRRYFQNQEAARQPLRFGREELRVMLCQLAVWALLYFGLIVGTIIVSVLAGVFAVLSPILMGLIFFFGFIGLFLFWIALAIRLAPAAALSTRQSKTHVLAANKVTKNRFWNLFVAYLVTYLGGYIGYYVINMISIGIATGDMNFVWALSGLGEENPRVLFDAAAERMKGPLGMTLGILAMIINAAAMSAWVLLVAGVNAYAVKWWDGDNPVPNFE
jgi:hypothetical protein